MLDSKWVDWLAGYLEQHLDCQLVGYSVHWKDCRLVQLSELQMAQLTDNLWGHLLVGCLVQWLADYLVHHLVHAMVLATVLETVLELDRLLDV